MDALAKAGHSFEPWSEIHDCAATEGNVAVAARTAMASDVVDWRGCFWRWLQGSRLQWSMAGGYRDICSIRRAARSQWHVWRRIRRPAAEAQIHDSMRGSDVSWGGVVGGI